MARYTLTSEHAAQLKPWAEKWIANALSTVQTTADTRKEARNAVEALYQAAHLQPPPRHRIIFVSSPIVMAFVGGIAAALWWLDDQQKSLPRTTLETTTKMATEAATRIATGMATEGAITSTTEDVTRTAIERTIGAMTRATTGIATGDAIEAAIGAAITAVVETHMVKKAVKLTQWSTASETPFLSLAHRFLGKQATRGLHCAAQWKALWNGGNQWSSHVGWISFFRTVVRLSLDYTHWDAYERLAHYGPRLLHPQFCLITECPIQLTVDANSQPHNDTGPFCRWSDGISLYAIHGIRIPAWIVEHPDRITVTHIQQEPNIEVRRILLTRYGVDRFISTSGARPLHTDHTGTLYRVPMMNDEPLTLVRVINRTREPDGTFKPYFIRVPSTMQTAREAVAWTFEKSAQDYAPLYET